MWSRGHSTPEPTVPTVHMAAWLRRIPVKALMEPSSRLNEESTLAGTVSSGKTNSKHGLAKKVLLTSVWVQPENHQLRLLR